MEPISEDAFSAVLQEQQREQPRQQPRVGKASPKPSHAYVKAKMETTTTDRMEKKNGDGDDSADMEEEERNQRIDEIEAEEYALNHLPEDDDYGENDTGYMNSHDPEIDY